MVFVGSKRRCIKNDDEEIASLFERIKLSSEPKPNLPQVETPVIKPMTPEKKVEHSFVP